jgi:dihydropteroate synthase
MGVVNVTPDSFSDGGRFFDHGQAVAHAERLLEEGADILDIGGESTRPGAAPVEAEEQVRRVVPVIRAVRRESDAPISIDTTSARVARVALDEGADIVNDVSALRDDPAMMSLLADRGVPVVLMHMLGAPRTMQIAPSYRDVVGEVVAFLRERLEWAAARGIEAGQTLVDPGFGFGKTLKHNLDLMRSLDAFHDLGRPIVVGPSRKSMIGKVLDRPVDGRLMGTAAAVAACVARGALVVRVHDVAEMRDVVRMTEAIEGAAP